MALEDVATPGLLDCIFRFASLNDEGTVALGTAAMSCVNELLSRIRITRDLEDFLMQVYRCVERCAGACLYARSAPEPVPVRASVPPAGTSPASSRNSPTTTPGRPARASTSSMTSTAKRSHAVAQGSVRPGPADFWRWAGVHEKGSQFFERHPVVHCCYLVLVARTLDPLPLADPVARALDPLQD